MQESGTAVCAFWYYFSPRRNENSPNPTPFVQAMGHFLMQYAAAQNTEQRRDSWCSANSKPVSIDYTSLRPMIYGSEQPRRRECCPASVCHLKEPQRGRACPTVSGATPEHLGAKALKYASASGRAPGDGGMISAVSEESQPFDLETKVEISRGRSGSQVDAQRSKCLLHFLLRSQKRRTEVGAGEQGQKCRSH